MIFGRLVRVFKIINIKKAIFYNFWLKAVSLIIAVIIWFYFSGGITQGIRV